jgi:phenylpropionate dioxygenase-like ring-hydroxylating dioxygenase large terminal subunit
MAEGGSRTVLLRSGWSETEVAPGERISVRGHPSRDGSNVVHLQYLILPDGSEKFGEDLDRSTLERLRRER